MPLRVPKNDPRFRAKSFGYGAGLPIAWQGWALLAAHLTVILGVATALQAQPLAATVCLILVGLAPLPIYRARTQGGWRWRSGSQDADKDEQ